MIAMALRAGGSPFSFTARRGPMKIVILRHGFVTEGAGIARCIEPSFGFMRKSVFILMTIKAGKTGMYGAGNIVGDNCTFYAFFMTRHTRAAVNRFIFVFLTD